MRPMNIGMNAQLLSGQAGYRSAGIHGYIYNTLRNLTESAPSGWRFKAWVGAQVMAEFPRIQLKHTRWNTESALKRVLWEQALQPWQLGGLDLYHAMAFVAPMILPVASVVTVYDLSFIHYPQVLPPARRLYLQMFTRLTCRRARRVIAISHSTAQDVAASFDIPSEQVDVAAPGYDPAVYRPLPPAEVAHFRQSKGLPPRFWLFIGTLEPRKNLTTLLRAYAHLPTAEQLPLILGGGKGWDYADIFATIEAHQLADKVHWVGFIPTDELPFWYNSAETFFYPSVFEGFGLPVLEAMACGTPVVVSESSSLPEIVGESGLRVSPYDENAWATALQHAFSDTTWRENAAQQGIKEVERYTWQQTAHKTLRSYECALT